MNKEQKGELKASLRECKELTKDGIDWDVMKLMIPQFSLFNHFDRLAPFLRDPYPHEKPDLDGYKKVEFFGELQSKKIAERLLPSFYMRVLQTLKYPHNIDRVKVAVKSLVINNSFVKEEQGWAKFSSPDIQNLMIHIMGLQDEIMRYCYAAVIFQPISLDVLDLWIDNDIDVPFGTEKIKIIKFNL